MKMLNRNRNGFTLMEIIIALSITAIIMSFIVGVVVNLVNQRDEVEKVSKTQLIGPAILHLISRDIQATFVYQLDDLKTKSAENDQENQENGNTNSNTSQQGDNSDNDIDAEEMKVKYFVGVDDGDEEDATDSLHFVTSLDSNLTIGGKQSDICEVGYYLKKTDNENRDDLWTLFRREDFFIDTEPIEGGKAIKIYDRVKALNIRYYKRPENESEYEDLYNGTAEYEDDWDNTEDESLPFAVEVTLWIDLSDDKEVARDDNFAKVYKYRTLILLPDFPLKEKLNEEESAR